MDEYFTVITKCFIGQIKPILQIDQTDRELSAILMSQNKKMLIKYFELMATPAIVFNASAVKAYKEMVEALKFEGELVKV